MEEENERKNPILPKVTVIIPVYNVERYIGKCLQTLQRQTLEELEFIFIDDCSSDTSMSVIERAAHEDPRIHIIRNRTNIGPGPSRNLGIAAAQGEFLSFTDPDDYVSPDYFEKLYNLAIQKKADIVKSHVIFVDNTGKRVKTRKSDNKRFIPYFFKTQPLFLCNSHEHYSQLFRRSFIVSDDNLRYADTRIGEDTAFLLKVNLKDPVFCICNDTEYYHVLRDDSLTGQVSFDNCLECLKSLEKRIDVFKACCFPQKYDIYLRNLVSYYISRFLKTDAAQKDITIRQDKRNIFKEMLDKTLAELPFPELITDGQNKYEILKQLTENRDLNVQDIPAASQQSGFLRRLGKKLIPERICIALFSAGMFNKQHTGRDKMIPFAKPKPLEFPFGFQRTNRVSAKDKNLPSALQGKLWMGQNKAEMGCSKTQISRKTFLIPWERIDIVRQAYAIVQQQQDGIRSVSEHFAERQTTDRRSDPFD